MSGIWRIRAEIDTTGFSVLSLMSETKCWVSPTRKGHVRFFRVAFELVTFSLIGLVFLYGGLWAFVVVPFLLLVGVYLDMEYFEAREKGQLTFYVFRSRERKMEEFWKTAREAENKLFHKNN